MQSNHMKISKFTAIFVVRLTFFVVCLIFAQPLNAQEAESRPKKTPRMTDEYSPGLRANPSSKPNDSTDQPEASNWLRYTPGNRTLSLELPGDLLPLDISPPENLRQVFKEIEGYTYYSNQLQAIVVYYSFNQTQVSPVELKAMVAGFMQGLTHNSKNTDVKFTTKLETPSRLSVNGSYLRDGVPAILNGLLVVKGSEVWIMMTGYLEGSVSSSVAAQRILNSAKL
jgi:hypothetical protein